MEIEFSKDDKQIMLSGLVLSPPVTHITPQTVARKVRKKAKVATKEFCMDTSIYPGVLFIGMNLSIFFCRV